MIINLTYEEFCDMWFDTAMKVADIVIANIKKKGTHLDSSLDVESVKMVGVTYALEKTYRTYDVDHEKHAQLQTYLSKLVRNCVLTELDKETTSVEHSHGSQRSKKGNVVSPGKAKEPHNYLETYGWAERKEEVLKKMMQLLKKLSPIDQVILSHWMENERTYLERCIEDLNLEDTKRNRDMLSLRRKRAFETLRDLMGGKRPNYRDIYIPSGKYKDADGMAGKYSSRDAVGDRNFERRRSRAATTYITRNVDYEAFSENVCKKMLRSE